MADAHEKVMQLVEAELKKNPDVSNQELFAKAKKTSRKVGELTLRQFHAKYPLQVKRKLAPPKPRRRRSRRRGKQTDTAAVRAVLLRFAGDLAAADGKAGVIDLYTQLDGYVDELAKAAGRA